MPLFSLFPIEPPQVSLAAASRAVVQGSDKGMYMYEECCMLCNNPHVALEGFQCCHSVSIYPYTTDF